jgi:hypothetical protein
MTAEYDQYDVKLEGSVAQPDLMGIYKSMGKSNERRRYHCSGKGSYLYYVASKSKWFVSKEMGSAPSDMTGKRVGCMYCASTEKKVEDIKGTWYTWESDDNNRSSSSAGRNLSKVKGQYINEGHLVSLVANAEGVKHTIPLDSEMTIELLGKLAQNDWVQANPAEGKRHLDPQNRLMYWKTHTVGVNSDAMRDQQ